MKPQASQKPSPKSFSATCQFPYKSLTVLLPSSPLTLINQLNHHAVIKQSVMSYTEPYLFSKSALFLHHYHATSTQPCGPDPPWNAQPSHPEPVVHLHALPPAVCSFL